ncbi:hypothetical protein KY284_035851 [Solanum tuberosum]|nr:hypothetical protein KY284_035851 [Solanum tuberosum]
MNSHENGKTYTRKMLPKGTTSTNPFTSAFPTSSTPTNEDRTIANKQVASDDTPISTFDKDGVEGTVSPSLANTRSKISDVIETPDSPMKFENLEDFFSRVRGQIKRAQSLDLSTDQSSPIDDKISATQKSTPLAEMLATAKENFPHFSLTLHRAKKDKVEYYKKAAKKSLLIDELIKNQELYTDLKDCSDKLEIQISKLEARKSSALDELEAEFLKELADSDVARVEESLIDFKSKIIE